MKKCVIMLTLLMVSVGAKAQDVIVKKDGSTIVSKVLEITETDIKYKKFTNQDGPTYSINKGEVNAINYENGDSDDFSKTAPTTTTATQPQSAIFDPTKRASDSELMGIVNKDLSFLQSKKAKRLRNIAWIGGGALVVAGVIPYMYDPEVNSGIGTGLIGAGVVWTASFLAASHYYKKKAEQEIYVMQSMPILQQEFNVTEHSSLMVGIDALRDNFQHSNAYGIGVRYHF